MRRKWFFGILILVVVGIVLAIVFINLFKERDTKALAEDLNEFATEGYLSDESSEYLTINSYLENLRTHFDDGAEKKEVKNYQDSYGAFIIAVDFFNNQMLFTKYSNEYKENVKEIQNDLKSAQEAAEKLKGYIDETKQIVSGSTFWTTNTWQTSRGYMKTIFEESKDVLTKLGRVYSSSVKSKLLNNEFTEIIFDGFNDLSNKVVANLTENGSVGSDLKVFVQAYYGETNVEYILGYRYNALLQNNVKDIKEKGLESGHYTSFLAGLLQGREAV